MEQSRVDLQLLHQAFESFTEATRTLENSYRALEEKASRLSGDLALKNKELELSLQERKKAESYLKNILESLPCGVIVLNCKGEIAVTNKTLSEITGFSLEEIVADPGIQAALKLRDFQLDRFLTETESPFFRKNGQGIILLFTVTRMKDTENNAWGSVIVVQDVPEVRRLEEQAKRSSRILAMEEMAAQIAENIRNPLGSVELFVSLLKRELKEEGPARRYAELISAGIRNLDNVMSNLLFFTYPVKPRFQAIEIGAILDESLEFAQHLIKQNGTRLIKDYSVVKSLFDEIKGDPDLLKQLFLNLIINAIQAMEGGGTLRVSAHLGKNGYGTSIWKEAESGNIEDELKVKTPELEIVFQDTGSGIAEEIRDKIFNPFFSTREQSSGLGLTIAHNIVSAHNGRLDFQSDSSRTTFRVSLPFDKQKAGEA